MKKIIPIVILVIAASMLYNNRRAVFSEENGQKIASSISGRVQEFLTSDDAKEVIVQTAKDAAAGAGKAVRSDETKKAVQGVLEDTGDFVSSPEFKSGARDAVEGVKGIVDDPDVRDAAKGVVEGADAAAEYSGLKGLLQKLWDGIKKRAKEVRSAEGQS